MAGAVAVVALVLGVTWAVLASGEDTVADDPTSLETTPSTDEPTSDTGSLEPEPTPTPTATPTEDAQPDAQCWDGSLIVRAEQACPAPNTLEAMKWALPIDWSSCVADSGAPYNQWSHSCLLRGVRVHVAAYRGQAERDLRLSGYGPCTPDGEGRIVCEPSASTDRYVRAYEGNILFYLSAASADLDVLMALPQRSAEEIRSGRPL